MDTGLELHETLAAHLGQGRMDGPGLERLHRMSRLLPAEAGGAGGVLWRASVLTGTQVDESKPRCGTAPAAPAGRPGT